MRRSAFRRFCASSWLKGEREKVLPSRSCCGCHLGSFEPRKGVDVIFCLVVYPAASIVKRVVSRHRAGTETARDRDSGRGRDTPSRWARVLARLVLDSIRYTSYRPQSKRTETTEHSRVVRIPTVVLDPTQQQLDLGEREHVLRCIRIAEVCIADGVRSAWWPPGRRRRRCARVSR